MTGEKKLSVVVFDSEKSFREPLYDDLEDVFDLRFQVPLPPKSEDFSEETRSADRMLIYVSPNYVNADSAYQFRQRFEGYDDEKSVFMSAMPELFQKPARENGINCVYLSTCRNSEHIIKAIYAPKGLVSVSLRASQNSAFV